MRSYKYARRRTSLRVNARYSSSRRRMRGNVTRNALHYQLGGIPLIPSNDPPRVLPRQWNAARLVFYGTGSKKLNDTTIISGIRTQILITEQDGTNLTYRVQKAYCWISITDGNPLKAPFTCKFHSVFGEGYNSVQSDYGGEVSYAKCGYLWPIGDRQATLLATQVDVIMEVLPVDTSQTWTVYLDILWRVQKEDIKVDVLDGVTASFPSALPFSSSRSSRAGSHDSIFSVIN